ncbi:ribonuclease [Streptomyces mashuensis]|uniref:Ribonuclease n=1 Tax=Streptomyces mashuensis TaxID=33904 RepID=A0A919B9G2_9ACTN|nr:ribonuclease domain-containing protein [Streptomyces mashuensis]GHF72054.1 ribonuclease [Streptomyces mashuensis]
MRTLTALLAVLPLLLLPACSSGSSGGHKTEQPARPATGTAPAWAKGMKTVTEDQLPPEARHTLQLIAKGGPFPYPKDGTVFGNHENRLPRQNRGYYHEYTVPTPGSRDRGARRIITGQHEERYYTGDHYKTFEAVVHP